METTQLYIELIIIGLETFIWMGIFLINIIGNEIVNVFNEIVNKFSSSLLLIGILYVIGILMDRLADMIFQKGENSIRNMSGLRAKSSFLIWKKYSAEKYADYSRSRIRILRSSILNIPLITISCIWCVCIYVDEPYTILVFILVLGIIFSYISYKAYHLSLKRYYDKACALENAENE